jgi:uncharacterized protein (TIGR03086 family)
VNPDVLRHTQSIAATVLAKVDAGQLSSPTPCASWNVGQLIDHLIGAQHWAAAGISGRPSESADGASAGDFSAAYAAAAEAAASAFEEEGALERTVNPGFGDMPATALLGLAIVDTFTHAWDLAKATGQSTDLDPQLATQLLAASKQSIPDAYRGPEGAPFGAAQGAPEGASAADELAAFLGRTV